ncbi:VanZ family protein [Frigoriflavimonas asaccharolytica]|uniref:Glycopeptide antibiotics resistance protein n=1 Tax=Frigoriflavimonas asaccharolytica TaxID=2735899 RepID=A0A8J8G5V3_9FLAO|nr:VanZ family protein [Frigoriflavimonas asaccharolytica]NRS91794.1 glycopeptide antibiotics resistance protein [Frigoriflavimonas asaccharolytica]
MIKRCYKIAIAIYTIALLYMMFFGLGREASDYRFLQVNPFQTIGHFCSANIKQQDFLLNIIGNIFVFSPFGMLGIIIKKFLRIRIITLPFVLFIAILELTQYFTGRGTADIDDVFLNTFGMMIGVGIMKLWNLLSNFTFQLYFGDNEKVPVNS